MVKTTIFRSELLNLSLKVQLRGGGLTACRCSSSYSTTARAETEGKEKDGKGEVRQSQRGDSRMAKAEPVGGTDCRDRHRQQWGGQISTRAA